MKTLFWLFVLALLAGAGALVAHRAGGNVVFLVPPFRVDLSLAFFLVLAAVLLLAVFWLARLLQRLADFPARVAIYRQRRGEVGAHRALREALRAFFEGRFARAERAAQTAQQLPEIAGLAALVGARAAHRLQEAKRRDEWLDRAEGDTGLETARLVTSAELWAESRDNARALDALERLRAGGARHIHAARIALNAHLHSGRWDDVLRGVKLLSKRRALHEAAARRLKLIAYRETLLARRHDAAALEAAFDAIDAADRKLPEVALLAARLFNVVGRGARAAQVLEEALEAEWNERLLDEYARAQSFPARTRIEHAEGWLQKHPQSAGLLRCLGELCLREHLWGKARVYLEESLRLQVHPHTSLALARLAEMTGQDAEAAQHYREAALGLSNVLSESAPELQRGSAASLQRDSAGTALI